MSEKNRGADPALPFGPWLFLACAILSLVMRPAASAEEPFWAPAGRDATGWDWARIDSGEWLKGELIFLQSSSITFDSKEFDEVEAASDRARRSRWNSLNSTSKSRMFHAYANYLPRRR